MYVNLRAVALFAEVNVTPFRSPMVDASRALTPSKLLSSSFGSVSLQIAAAAPRNGALRFFTKSFLAPTANAFNGSVTTFKLAFAFGTRCLTPCLTVLQTRFTSSLNPGLLLLLVTIS
jgi:hypothetical protein